MLVILSSYHINSQVLLRGTVFQKIDEDLDIGIPAHAFRVQNEDGDTVAVLNSQAFNDSRINPMSPYTVPAGSLILKGRVFQGYNPDWQFTQGL